MLGSILLLVASVCVCQCPGTLASPLFSVEGGDAVLSEFEDLPILVPNTGSIDSAMLKEKGADKFLSLWHIFVLSGKVVVSDEPWSLFAPLNEGLPRDPSFLSDADFTREVLLNHITLGDVIDLETAVKGASPFYSLADSELVLTTEGGTTFVNGIALTGDVLEVNNGVVYIIEEAIPLSQPEFLEFVPLLEADLDAASLSGNLLNQDQPTDTTFQANEAVENPLVVEEVFDTDAGQLSTESPSESPDSAASKPTSRPTRFDKFRNRNGPPPPRNFTSSNDLLALLSKAMMSTHVPITTKQQIETTSEPSTTPSIFLDEEIILEDLVLLPNNEKEENILGNGDVENIFREFAEEEFPLTQHSTFLDSLVHTLEAPNSVGAEFYHHFMDAGLGQYLASDKNYTAIIPTNDAFYEYYPIDWGFNPFLVENFTKDVLLNHVLEGDLHLQGFKDPVEIQTIEGRIIKVDKDKDGALTINDNVISRENELEMPNGRIYFIHQILFTDYNRVNDLRSKYPFLETAPLLSFPWPSSPFLSHLLNRLVENPQTKLFAHFLRNSDISHLVSSSDENLNRLTYTAFVPTDEALKKSFRVENLAVLERKAINDFLLEHIVPGYLFEEDFEDGFNLLSLTNKAIPIKMTEGKDDIFIGPAKIYKPQQFVYNLGAIFLIDKPFMEIEVNEPETSLLERVEEDAAMIHKPSSSPFVEAIPDRQSEFPTLQPQPPPTTTTTEAPTSPVPVTKHPEINFEIRTEISFSRQINDGAMEPITRDIIERAIG